MRSIFLRRPTLALLAIALWLCFASLPPAETRQLYLKVSGKITGTSKIKVNNSTLKQNGDPDSKLVLDVGQSITITDIVATVTNNIVDTNGVTNAVIDTVTNTITNAIADAISVLLVDPQGNPVSTLIEFDTINGIDTSDMRERLFATGYGVESVSDVNGEITFGDVTLAGRIQFTPAGDPRVVDATIQANGDVDGDDFVFTGKLSADNPFIPAPTNFNLNAKAPRK